MGHSLASEEETLAAIEAGASRCTYIFNAMPALFHRSSSLTAVALTDDRVSIEIIADGFHLHSTIVKMILKCKKPDKLIAISNAVLGETIPFDNQPAIIRNKYGILSGSNMGLKDIWKNLSTFGNMSEALAAACITANPARDLGLLMRGEIYPGKFADFTLFSVKTNQILGTVKHGKFIFRREDFMES